MLTMSTWASWGRCASQVGLLDIDLCGPSIPTMLGLQGQSVMQGTTGYVPSRTLAGDCRDVPHGPVDRNTRVTASRWIPIFADKEQRLAVMSIGFLLDKPDDAVVWRGPRKSCTPPSSSGCSADYRSDD